MLKMITLIATMLAIPAVAQTIAPTATPAVPPEHAPCEVHAPKPSPDWAGLQRYRADNTALPAASASGKPRIVFFGDSITDVWGRIPDSGTFFPGKDYINRGIGGQTTPQMLIRFEQDVVHLQPAVVVILGGTNDVAGNTGPSTPAMTEDNYTAMLKIAQGSGIKVILASITPAVHYAWRPEVQPVAAIRELNQWIRETCATGACTYLDYYTAMSDANGAMLPGYSKDGVHPTSLGYGVMAPLAERAIAQVLGK